jgi:uncharacterized protein YbdZ (MbtH family)
MFTFIYDQIGAMTASRYANVEEQYSLWEQTHRLPRLARQHVLVPNQRAK